jgi:hypothetical protein
LGSIEPHEELEESNKLSIRLARTRSRIVALPGHDPKTIRGFSSPRLIVVDEAAFVLDGRARAGQRALLPTTRALGRRVRTRSMMPLAVLRWKVMTKSPTTSGSCGERQAKSSAISFIVTNRTPG